MKDFERRNQHFDRLMSTPGLRWMGQNTNHYASHPAVRKALVDCIDGEAFHAYAPPVGLEELRDLVVRDLGLDGLSALITDGAVSGLYHVCGTLCGPGDQFVTTDPTWAWPMSFARAAGAEVIQIPIYGAEHGYRLDPERLRAVVTPRTKVIYIVDPNNPVGTCCTADEIAAIVDIARSVGAYLIHDCTYRDFAFEHHLAAKLYPERTVTVWSFSKWLGFAGLRMGALVTHPDLAEKLAAAPPNNLGSSILAQRGAIAGLKVKHEWFPAVLAAQRESQGRVRDVALSCGLHLPVFPSNGNFLVIECDQAGLRPEAICMAMAKRNIQIRHGGYHTKAFGDRFIKVSVSVPTEWVDEFCAALPEAVEEARGINETVAMF
ncbi:pyridoxal phosphate-dependent aminotransferase [Rhodoplanes roseus]|uniref:Aminotransferase n=1 Tax=Rhodoplanes roseus TaxID=29409 RepID=A0A327L3U9_9BRAD|nr:pyridoxal phosphate-dependent aminotransferase [Rhodoplanes roseus]RAI44503.1 aspartate aminotransferase [Rhodoplanes roseus]